MGFGLWQDFCSSEGALIIPEIISQKESVLFVPWQKGRYHIYQYQRLFVEVIYIFRNLLEVELPGAVCGARCEGVSQGRGARLRSLTTWQCHLLIGHVNELVDRPNASLEFDASRMIGEQFLRRERKIKKNVN